MASMGRSDHRAYDYNYNTSIFEYWSNKPFEMLIAGPDDINTLKLKTETINNTIKQYMPRKDLKRPENIKFKHFPVDVLKMKRYQGLSILKLDPKEIKEKLISPDFDFKGAMGLDCAFYSKTEDLSVLNSVLHPLLFDTRLLSEEELNLFIKTHALPFSTSSFSYASIQSKNAALYLTEGGEDGNGVNEDDEDVDDIDIARESGGGDDVK